MLLSFISPVLTVSLVHKLTNHLQATMITNIDTDIVTNNSSWDKALSYWLPAEGSGERSFL